jgi:septum formation protein
MLKDKIKNFNLILGSRSPRRIELLREAGIPFTLGIPHELDENYPPGLNKLQIPVYLSEMKSKTYGEIGEKDILLTADTIVWLEDQIINKPSDFSEAFRMLSSLSGKMHEVITGVCLRNKNRMSSFYSCSEVYFSRLSREEIEFYIETCKPYDKAGAYGVQEWIGYMGIERINGSHFNVMGLPVQKLYRELEQFLLF